MQATQQPSVKNLLISCLVGCFLIILAGVGLSLYSHNEAETTSVAKPMLNAVAPPITLVMLSKPDEVAAYTQLIKDVKRSVETFDVKNHTTQITDLDDALKKFDSWASFIGKGIDMNLSAYASAELKKLYGTIQTLQQNSLPVLRDQYGPLIRAEFAKFKTTKSAITVGKGFRNLVVTSADFKDKEAAEQFHAASLELFANLRFEKITYRTRKWDDKPTVMDMASNADNLLIDWTSNDTAGALGVEHTFTASNHRKAATTTAETETVR
ncbi:MAG: hypothetical protein V3U65_03150 [Granulosicoccaceae bacterium]